MALGEILKNAREQRGLNPSAVAECTHMKVQVIEDLEREDFKRIAAPIYGRGFVKLYAEFLELDPEPLVRDFVELYAGARAPTVRTKPIDAPAEPPVSTPVKRTVTGVASAQPQRQSVQAKPAVRPLSSPLPEVVSAKAEPVVEQAAVAGDAELPALDAGGERAGAAVHDGGEPAFVVPEESDSDIDDLDLFKQPSPHRKPVAVVEEDAEGRSLPDAGKPQRQRRLPVFKIGGRLENEDLGPEPALDEAAAEKRNARVQAFLHGVRSLMDGIERNLPTSLSQKKAIVFGCCCCALLGVMAAGVTLLFKMTGHAASERSGAAVEAVASSPCLYVD